MPAPTGPHQSREAAQPTTEPGDTRGTVVAPYGLPSGPFGPPAAPREIGTLGPYRVVKELGRGGMGIVYAAIDTRLNRPVALKVMLPYHATEAGARERFLREARAAAQIVHDNVVTVHEADVRDGVPYIVMQFLEGCSLDAYLRKNGTPTVQQVLRIARETAGGLAAAHARGLVHRDIKPGNLWLEAPNGRVKILDFGLARAVNADVELTVSGAVVGTPAYMSPEQGRGEKVDHRTDLFSLGAVLYRLCTGRPPFDGPNAMAVLTALGGREPIPVRALNPAVPEPVSALVHQLLAKDPGARPQTADEVARRVDAIEDALSVPPGAGSASQPQVIYVPIPVAPQPQANPFAELDLSGTAPFPSATDVTEIDRAPRKPGARWPWAVLGLAVAVAVIAGGFIIFKNTNATDTKADPPNGALASGKDGKPSTPVAPVAPADPDRRVAEWVLSLGGTVYLSGDYREVSTLAALPQGRFKLAIVRLIDKPVTDADLAHLKDLKELADLDLSGTQVTDAGLVHLTNLKELQSLRLTKTAITDAGLVHLNALKGLKELTLASTAVTDEGLIGLTELKELSSLNLGGTSVKGTGLAHLKGLTILWLHHSKASNEGLAQISELKALKDLNLGDTKVTDAGMAHLKQLKALTILHLYQTSVTNDALAHLKDCNTLTDLWLSDTKVTDAGLAHLKNLTGLRGLGLNNTRVTDAGLNYLKERKGLTSLTITGTAVTPKGVQEFAAAVPACKIEHDGVIEPKVDADPDRRAAEWVLSLRGVVWVSGKGEVQAADQLPPARFRVTAVNLSDTKVTDAELARFADLKELETVWLNGTAVSDAGLKHLKNLKRLKHLQLSGTKVSDAGLNHLTELTGLVQLHLDDTPVTDAGLAHLKPLQGLAILWLRQNAVTNDGLAHLRDLPRLKELNLGDTQVTDAGLVHLKDLKELTVLNLFNTEVDGTGLTHVKGLTVLWLNFAPLTDTGMAALAELKGLKDLHLGSTPITDAQMVHLKELKALKDLAVENTELTDAALVHLKDLKALTNLLVARTKMTAKGLEEFGAAVPRCKIEHDGVIGPKK